MEVHNIAHLSQAGELRSNNRGGHLGEIELGEGKDSNAGMEREPELVIIIFKTRQLIKTWIFCLIFGWKYAVYSIILGKEKTFLI